MVEIPGGGFASEMGSDMLIDLLESTYPVYLLS